jgi:hypothetical protein
MAHQITYETRGSYIRYSGAVTIEEITDLVRRGQASPGFSDRRYTIHDFSDVEQLSFSATTVEALAATDCGAAITNRALQVIVIATRPEVDELVRAYANVGLPVFPVHRVTTLEAARRWLAAAVA